MRKRGTFWEILHKITLVLATFCCFFSLSPTQAATVTYTGASDDFWNVPSNWDSNAVPTANDDVVLAPGFTVIVPGGTSIDFHSLQVTASSILRLIGDIHNGGSITMVGAGKIFQENTHKQILSGDLRMSGNNTGIRTIPNVSSVAAVIKFEAQNIYTSSSVRVYAFDDGYGSVASGESGNGPGAGLASASAGGGGAGNDGAGGAGGGVGAGVGGSGGLCNAQTGLTIGSSGGGGTTGTSGPGGGAVTLIARGTMVFDDGFTIRAQASTGGSGDAGGGAGGSIYLKAQNIIDTSGGNLFMTAAGGGGGASGGGGGGGGCMLIRYTGSSNLNTLTFAHTGGFPGTGGTAGADGSLLSQSFATNTDPIVPSSTSNVTTSSADYTWTSGDGFEQYFTLALSTDGVTYADIARTSATSSLTGTYSYTYNNLLPGTRYWLAVASGNGVDPTSSYLFSDPLYTLANPAVAPSITSRTTSTLGLVFNDDGNGSSTTYALFNLTSQGYVTAAGTPTTTPLFFSSSTWNGFVLNLTPSTSYQFSVVAKNGAGSNAATSTPSIATTTLSNVLITPNQPGAPTVSNPTTSTLQIILNTNGNSAATTYAILNAALGKYVDSRGSPTSTIVYFSSTTWNNGFVVGLLANTAYQFVIIAQSTDGITTSSPTSTVHFTLANSALAPAVTPSGTSMVNLVLNTNLNPANTLYAIFDASDGRYITATGSTVGFSVFFVSSTWGGIVNGLSADMVYHFGVVARNGDAVDSPTSSLSSAVYTLANPASPVTVTSTGTSTLVVQFGQNGNPTSSVYALYNATNASYLTALGSPTTTAFFQTAASWGGSVTSTGLVPNIAYQFGVIARNGANVAAATTTASSVYTFASVPTGLTSTARTASSITVSWTGDGTEFYVENVTSETNSGWMSATSFTFSGLACNTEYALRVKNRNGDAVETQFTSTINFATDVCPIVGGGGTVGVPAGGGGGGGSYGGGAYVFPTSTFVIPFSSSTPLVSTTQRFFTIDQLYPSTGNGLPALGVKIPIVPTIIFYNKPTSPVRLGTSFDFRYTVTNTTTLVRTVRVERTLSNARGTILTRATVLIRQKAAQKFTAVPRVGLPQKYPAGVYTIRIRVLTTSGRVIAVDGFSFDTHR